MKKLCMYACVIGSIMNSSYAMEGTRAMPLAQGPAAEASELFRDPEIVDTLKSELAAQGIEPTEEEFKDMMLQAQEIAGDQMRFASSRLGRTILDVEREKARLNQEWRRLQGEINSLNEQNALAIGDDPGILSRIDRLESEKMSIENQISIIQGDIDRLQDDYRRIRAGEQPLTSEGQNALRAGFTESAGNMFTAALEGVKAFPSEAPGMLERGARRVGRWVREHPYLTTAGTAIGTGVYAYKRPESYVGKGARAAGAKIEEWAPSVKKFRKGTSEKLMDAYAKAEEKWTSLRRFAAKQRHKLPFSEDYLNDLRGKKRSLDAEFVAVTSERDQIIAELKLLGLVDDEGNLQGTDMITYAADKGFEAKDNATEKDKNTVKRANNLLNERKQLDDKKEKLTKTIQKFVDDITEAEEKQGS